MTDHPCKGRSAAQIDAFEAIAVNGAPSCKPATLAALESAGLIVRAGSSTVGKDAFGAVTVPAYVVPLPVHMQWCAWAAEQPD